MVDYKLYLQRCDANWQGILLHALKEMDQNYLLQLLDDQTWLPGIKRLFAAFSLPLLKTQYILLGESPYPRAASANGYAFWDASVDSLWSETGLNKSVNRVTSLRNWLKMLLIARGLLDVNDTSQKRIAALNKNFLVQTAEQLFSGMMRKGILLLNASLVYSKGKIPYHARFWKVFMHSLFTQLVQIKPEIKLILLGNIAKSIPENKLPIGLAAEHPYNLSFISNQAVIEFFKPLDLLEYAKH